MFNLFKTIYGRVIFAINNKDVKKLEIVADRFSKIGSVPVLKPENVYETLERNIAYIKKRTSEKITFEITGDPTIHAQVNASLFDWVIENLCNNAINAIGIQGAIKLSVSQQKNKVFIEGNVNAPGSYALDVYKDLKTLINLGAKGLLPNTYLKKLDINKVDDKGSLSFKTYNLSSILNDQIKVTLEETD